MNTPTITATSLTHKHLIEESTWELLVAQIAKKTGYEPQISARIMDQALGFLQLVALCPGGMYAPSPMVDHGWHAFLQNTREYAEFCQAVAGHFIHHSPLDEPGVVYTTNEVARTLAAMEAHGLMVDVELWDGTIGDCSAHECYTCVE